MTRDDCNTLIDAALAQARALEFRATNVAAIRPATMPGIIGTLEEQARNIRDAVKALRAIMEKASERPAKSRTRKPVSDISDRHRDRPAQAAKVGGRKIRRSARR